MTIVWSAQHRLPKLSLIAPPMLGVSPVNEPSLSPFATRSPPPSSPSRSRTSLIRRRLSSLPSLRSLSLLPPTPPLRRDRGGTSVRVAPFRSRAAHSRTPGEGMSTTARLPPRTPPPSPSKDFESNEPLPLALSSRGAVPTGVSNDRENVIRLETDSKLLQRRKQNWLLRHRIESENFSSLCSMSRSPPSPPRTDTVSPPQFELEVVRDSAGAGFTRRKRSRSTDDHDVEDGEAFTRRNEIRSKCARWARHVRSSTESWDVAMGTLDRPVVFSLSEERSTRQEIEGRRNSSVGARRGRSLSCLQII